MQATEKHRHDWQHTGGKAGWVYTCAICGKKSRNDFYQEPAFRRPLRIRSTILIGEGAGLSWVTDGSDLRQ